MMKDDFCAVGIGQGGSKMAKEFYDNKYRSFFINTSYDDLSQLKVNDELVYHVPASKGCAKQRDVAVEYAKNYYEQMTGKLIDTHPTVKVYIVHFTLGGGTGGGLSNLFMGTLRNKLNSMGKKDVMIIAVVAKPRNYESWQLQNNAQESLKELYALVSRDIVDQYYIIDNDSRDNLEEINQEHCILFDRWIEGEGANNQSIADESERMDLFKYKGQSMMFEFDATDNSSFGEKCKEAYEQSIYCLPIKQPQAVGMAIHEKVKESIAMDSISHTVGYFPNNHITPTQVSNMIMVAGCEENKNIKNSIIKLANEKAELINQDISDDVEETELKTINNTRKSKAKKGSTEKMASIDDILNLFS